MKLSEKILTILAFVALGSLSLWLQLDILPDDDNAKQVQTHEPDYYIKNFTAVGMDQAGRRRYVLEAERMVHYPDDGTALLDNPHIVQYEDNKPPRHTYSESGWMSANGDEVLLTGNVRVIEKRGQKTGGVVLTTEKLRILLDKEKKS